MRVLLPCLLLVLLFAKTAAAQKTKLPFPSEPNNLQILAQRFLYALVDAHTLRIGDILIDSNKLSLDIASDPAKGTSLTFTWPAALLSEGRITLLNNNGKALWSERFNPKKIAIDGGRSESDEDLRSESARYTSAPLEENLVKELRRLPFLNFCISNETADTKIYLCSADLSWRQDKSGQASVRPRGFSRLPAQVSINGSVVSPQGIVYLNQPDQQLFMQARTQSGVSIDIITRRNDIAYSDAVLSDDGTKILLTSRGAEPANQKGARLLGPNEYQVVLPVSRPYYYLLGKGGIPLRQEFLVKGDLPRESQRAWLNSRPPTRTYASSITLEGQAPEGVRLKVDGKKNSLESRGNHFEWTLRQLEPGPNQRRLLMEQGDRQLVAQHEILRGRPNEAGGDLQLQALNQIARGEIFYQRWMDRFFGLGGEAAEFHWGWGLSYRKQLNTKTDHSELDWITLALSYRFQDGMPFVDRSWGVNLLASSVRANRQGSTAFGLDLVYKSPPPEDGRWSRRFDWWDAKLRLWPVSSGSNGKLAFSWETEAQVYRRASAHSYWKAGAGLSQLKTTPAAPKEGPQIDLKLGYLINF
ncbi:MAG: hypothetical protein KF865_05385 [Bdellovibrionaceae bacterium]|nr:hypothetical protein [Pseudobdellovibrionaceae bacterium]